MDQQARPAGGWLRAKALYKDRTELTACPSTSGEPKKQLREKKASQLAETAQTTTASLGNERYRGLLLARFRLLFYKHPWNSFGNSPQRH